MCLVSEEEVIIDDPPSISSELEEMLEEMKDSLIKSITAQSIFDIFGKGREGFELGYSDYVNNVRKIEAYICQYVEVCCGIDSNSLQLILIFTINSNFYNKFYIL